MEENTNQDNNVLGGQSSQAALLTQYQEVRTELRDLQAINRRRTFAGVGAIGAIIGYALTTDTLFLLLSVPIILTYLYVLGVETWIGVMFLAFHSKKIEDSICIDEFSWETKYGGMWENNDRKIPSSHGPLAWNDVPKYAAYSIGVLSYFLSIVVSIFVIWEELSASDWRIAITLLVIILNLLLVVIGIVTFYSYIRVRNHLNNQ